MMKKLLLMLLMVTGGVMSANADPVLEFHFNYNSDWSGASSYPVFTDKGINSGNTSEHIYEFVLNKSNGLGDGDIYFRLHYQGWTNDIGPGSNFTFTFDKEHITGNYHQWHGEASWDNTHYYCIPQSTVKASEYKITVYGQQDNHYAINVDVASMPLSVTAVGYATYSNAFALDFTNISSVSAYRVESASKGSVKLSQFTGAVPAETGLLLKSSGAVSINVPVVVYSGDFTNMLKASVTATDLTGGSTSPYRYILAGSDDSTIGFYYVNKDRTSSAGKAYLESYTDLSPASGARVSWIFEDQETTGINNVKSVELNNEVYNLNGQRVNNAVRGLYIVNGKKVIMK